MKSSPRFPGQMLSVLAARCDEPSQWQHGYALAKQTGLKSGTLYPILIRLAGRASATEALASAARLAAAKAARTPAVRGAVVGVVP